MKSIGWGVVCLFCFCCRVQLEHLTHVFPVLRHFCDFTRCFHSGLLQYMLNCLSGVGFLGFFLFLHTNRQLHLARQGEVALYASISCNIMCSASCNWGSCIQSSVLLLTAEWAGAKREPKEDAAQHPAISFLFLVLHASVEPGPAACITGAMTLTPQVLQFAKLNFNVTTQCLKLVFCRGVPVKSAAVSWSKEEWFLKLNIGLEHADTVLFVFLHVVVFFLPGLYVPQTANVCLLMLSSS